MKIARLAVLTAALALPALSWAQTGTSSTAPAPAGTPASAPGAGNGRGGGRGGGQGHRNGHKPGSKSGPNGAIAGARAAKLKAASDAEHASLQDLSTKFRADLQAAQSDTTLSDSQREAKLAAIRQDNATARKAVHDKAKADRMSAVSPAPAAATTSAPAPAPATP